MMCFKLPTAVSWLGDPMKVNSKHKKGKAMVLVKSNNAPVVCNESREPSNRCSTTLLIPELHWHLSLP